MKFLANFSIKNTLLVNLAFIFIALAGYLAMKNMQREAFPNVSLDKVMVTTAYPGATPSEIEKLITIPIEKELKEVEDIDEIDSVSSEGISIITVKIEEDANNKDRVINDIQRAVDRAEDLPDDLVDKPFVVDLKTKNTPIIEVSLSGELSEKKIRNYAKTLEKKLLDIPDIARIDFRGLRDKEIWVDVLPQTLKEKHLSVAEISQALQKQNRTIPGGKIYLNNREYLLRTTGEFKNADDVKETIVRASALGGWMRVKDIAEVKEGFEEETIINKTQGTRSINLVIIKKEKGDAITLVNDIKTLIAEFKKTTDPNLTISFLNDMSFYIERRQNVLINNGLLGMLMVIIAMFTFLSKRTALAAIIGIPTALFLTFSFMHILGISFNLLSMFGLIMVLGMLVDEDIVISENIYKHLEFKTEPDKATVTGVAEVAWPLVATVLTTVAAFIPLMMMSGLMGKFIRNIPFVVCITLFASLFQALIILPSHIFHFNSGRFAAKRKKSIQAKTHMLWLIKKYKNTLRTIIKWRYVATLILIFIFAGLLYFAKTHMKFILFPSKGIEIIHVKAEAEEGDSLEITSKKIHQIEALISKLPSKEIDNYTTNVGIIQRNPRDVESKRTPYVGQMIIYLTPEKDRTRDSQEIINDLRNKSKSIQGFTRIDFEKIKHGFPVGKPIQVRITGDDFSKLQKVTTLIKDALTSIKGVNDIQDDYDVNKDEYRIMVDPIKAAQAGLTVENIATSIRNAFDGSIATKIKTSEEEIDVLVKFPIRLRYDHNTLESLLIPNNQGNLINIKNIAHFEKYKGILAIQHHDGIRTINVTANVNEDETSAIHVSQMLTNTIKEAEKNNPNIAILFGGEVEETQESINNMFNAFYLAAALILFILITMFRSLAQPFIIMLTVPFSVIGIIMAFYFHQEDLSFMALMGVVGMTGVVVDSGILMIDFMNKLRARGVDVKESIIEGAAVRLRAIILTTLTTFFGIIPAAYGLGGSDPFIKPMALALNYGIVSGALVTIFFVPVFMYMVEDAKCLIEKIIHMRLRAK